MNQIPLIRNHKSLTSYETHSLLFRYDECSGVTMKRRVRVKGRNVCSYEVIES